MCDFLFVVGKVVNMIIIYNNRQKRYGEAPQGPCPCRGVKGICKMIPFTPGATRVKHLKVGAAGTVRWAFALPFVLKRAREEERGGGIRSRCGTVGVRPPLHTHGGWDQEARKPTPGHEWQ